MTTILDCGNGRGKLLNYHSPYASLFFDLTPDRIRRFCLSGYLSRDEYYYWLLYLGYSPKQIDWLYALDSVPVSEIIAERR